MQMASRRAKSNQKGFTAQGAEKSRSSNLRWSTKKKPVAKAAGFFK